ncbi:tail fiber domain-containing protein [Pseudooctadecabacter sp.]|uniref:tail fiber domain-containing protein n=1 Tax=Pseudooctadecabacter sp. TaxID=1966338 RepID=UPI0025F8D94D|nr:tail fiber domain-containing protein [Pseudooctadecabacter sp.]
MKHHLIALSTASLLALSTATHAGGLAEPVMEMAPVEIVEDTTGSSAGNLIIPLILIAMIAVAASSSGSDPLVETISDIRTKTDITPVGTAANGLPLYHYRYIGAPTVFEGVMAQDVMMHTPQAVTLQAGGYMTVNYDMLGLDLKIVD